MADRVGQRFGDYRLKRFLGQGTFGDVYLGEQVYDNSLAAVKVFKTQLTPDKLKDFINEVRTVLLKHPNIVPLLDFGIGEYDIPYLVMEYAPNGTLLQRHPRGKPLPFATIVTYVKQIASALQYAHDQRRIHRDVKPENMLFGANNEILLSDFGIAVVAHSTYSQRTEDAIGTAIYMAPEQWQGKPVPATDQYALGIIVYEWLCGECPFGGGTLQLMYQHLHVSPPPLHTKFPNIASEAEQVVLTALAKNPDERFGSVQAFANALEQIQHSKQSSTIVSLSDSQPASPSRSGQSPPPSPVPPTGPVITSPISSTEPGIAPSPLSPPLIYLGHRSGANAVAWALTGNYIATGSSDRMIRIWDINTGTILTTYSKHTDIVLAVAWSPDGKRIVSSSRDATIQIWDASSGLTLLTYTELASPAIVIWSPDGRRIASYGSRNSETTVQVWDALTGNKLLTYMGHSKPVTTMAWSPDGRRIASGGADSIVQVWDVETGDSIYTYHDKFSVRGITWSPDGRRIASSSYDVQVWDAETGAVFVKYSRHRSPRYVTWSPNGKYIASSNERFLSPFKEKAEVDIWNAATGTNISTYREHSTDVTALTWSPDSTRIVSASLSEIRVWGIFVGNTLRSYQAHLDKVGNPVWSPNGNYIATIGEHNHTLQVWDAKTGVKRFSSFSKARYPHVKWSPDGRYIVFNSDEDDEHNDKLQILDAETGTARWSSQRYKPAWSPDGRYIVLRSDKGILQILDAEMGTARWSSEGYEATWSSDGKHIAINNLVTLEVRDAIKGTVVYSYKVMDYFHGVEWSPDGRRIATHTSDKSSGSSIAVWDASEGFKFSRKPVIIHTTRGIMRTRWLPDSRHIVVEFWGNN